MAFFLVLAAGCASKPIAAVPAPAAPAPAPAPVPITPARQLNSPEREFWRPVASGIQAAAFLPDFETAETPPKSVPWPQAGGETRALLVIKADPRRAPPVLLNKSALGFEAPVADVAREKGLLLATNASMYATDYSTSIGYMRNFGHVNNPAFSARLKAFLVFHPKAAGLSPVRIIEKSDPNWKREIAKYDSVIETYRMLSRAGENQWKPDTAFYYQVALCGLDKSGNLLFFFYPPRIDMFSLNEYIKTLPLELEGLLYLDGDSKGVLNFAADTGLSSFGYGGPLPNILGLSSARN
jgi:hypothetical protein